MERQKIGRLNWKISNSKRRRIATPTLSARNDRRGGFTLVELVITIAIVIILSVISVPIYRGYVDKARMSEGYALLGAILSAQKTYYSEYGNFLRNSESSGSTSYEQVLNIDARGNKWFSLFNVGSGEDIAGLEKRYFDAGIWIPIEFREPYRNKLYLLYNITKGAKFGIGNSGQMVDDSWKI